MRERRRAQARGQAWAGLLCLGWGGWGLLSHLPAWYLAVAVACGAANLAVAVWLLRS